MSPRKTFFITGTGTDVGKTFVAAGMASLCVQAGLKTAVMKPVQTGAGDCASTDISAISKLVPGLFRLPGHIASPAVFSLPASPHLAARAENAAISPASLLDAYKKIKDFTLDVLLVEGAGGVLVPLTQDFLIIDLIKKMRATAIVTALTSLGTINHTLLTIHALRTHGVEIAGVVFNMMPAKPGIVHLDNVVTVERLGKVSVLGIVKKLPHGKRSMPHAVLREFDRQAELKKLLLDS
ncbi:MAG: dethiobiotin synthase [Victivallales bacterium]|nr:dethiobiotin synthase [Victivallales bacterium]